MAILHPSFIWDASLIPDSSGTATAMWQYPNLSPRSSFSSYPDSATMSSPVMPMSIAPDATNSGMSWARRNRTSTSWLRALM